MLTKLQLLFIITLFCVSFVSDLVLNDLVRKPLANYHSSVIIKSLEGYFKEKSILVAGVYAGVTVVLAYVMLMLIWHTLGGRTLPAREVVYSNLTTASVAGFGYELITAFILGYAIDILIHKMGIFGTSLDNYYAVAGSGFWGALAFVFAIIITYALLRVLVKSLI